MEIVELINAGAQAGLTFYFDAAKLVIEGPGSAEGLVLSLLERMPEVARAISCPPPTAPGDCVDCGEPHDDLITGYCARCEALRRFLANDLPCGCLAVRRWRHRDGGFRWYCGICEIDLAPSNAVWSRKCEQPAGAEIEVNQNAAIGHAQNSI